jgi:hypothetical protein
MCSPNMPMLMGALGLGLQTFGAAREVQAQNQAAEYNAAIARQNAYIQEENARLAEQRAADATRRGEIEEKQHRLRVSQFIGEQRTSFAGSGVVVGSGSPLTNVQDTAAAGEYDALTIKHNAAMEAWGNTMQARNERLIGQTYSTQAQMYQSQKRSPLLAAGSTMLTGMNSLNRQFGLY